MLYKKVGRYYKEVGNEFMGFPADGVWLVQHNSQSLMLNMEDLADLHKRVKVQGDLSNKICDIIIKGDSAWKTAQEIAKLYVYGEVKTQ